MIENTIVLQQNKSATNLSVRKNGETWVKQRLDLTVFPNKSGKYFLPRIPVEVEVAESLKEKIGGVMLTEPMYFEVELPDAKMNADEYWLTATSLNVDQSFTNQEEWRVGDAVTREIKLTAKNTSSMMLPTFNFEDVEKVKAYVSTAKNKDSSFRSIYQGEKTQKVVYIIQENGSIEIPDLKIYWWDFENDVLNEEIIEGFTVEGKHTFKSWIKEYTYHLLSGFALLLLLFFIRKHIISAIRFVWNTNGVRFNRALFVKDYAKANQLNYERLRQINHELTMKSVEKIKESDLNNWMEVYEKDNQHSSSNIKAIRHSILLIKKAKEKESKSILKFK